MHKVSMTVNEAVAYCGIGRTKLYDLVKEGKLTPRKLGTRTLFLAEEIDAFVRSLPKGGLNEDNTKGGMA